MARINLLLALIVLSFSCTRERLDDIELMSYHWKCCENKKPYIGFHYYVLLKKGGEATLCVQNRNISTKIDCFGFVIDKSIINEVIASSVQFLADSNMNYRKITRTMMDEALIKIRINQGTSNKTINFYNTDGFPQIHNFMKLFHYVDSIYMNTKYIRMEEKLDIIKRKDEFIRYSMRIDTIAIPPPPPPEILYKKRQ